MGAELTPRMTAWLAGAAKNTNGWIARNNIQNGGGTWGALARRGLIAEGKHKDGNRGWFVSPAGYTALGIDRPADQGRHSLHDALEEASRHADPAEHHTASHTTHRFDSTEEAYDATQYRDDIKDGDILVIESERVAGFLRRAWPVAITTAHGELHTLTAPAREIDGGQYAASAEAAERTARELGFEVNELHAEAVEDAPAPAEEPRYIVEVDHHVKARPGDLNDPSLYEARYVIRRVGWADEEARFHLPYNPSRNDAETLKAHGWTLIGELQYIASPNLFRGRVERAQPAGNVIDRVDAAVRGAAGVSGPGESPCSCPRGESNVYAAHHRTHCQPVDERPKCLHGTTPRPDVTGDPVAACRSKSGNESFGAFNDEGCFYAYDCAVDVANEAAKENEATECPADEPGNAWGRLCAEHEEQLADGCEECFADDENDDADE